MKRAIAVAAAILIGVGAGISVPLDIQENTVVFTDDIGKILLDLQA
ncbi:hypothetical protein [Veillonella caviae]|nr:hypothetical protein [Veillonella caviae]